MQELCTAVAVLLHYFFLAAFFLMLVEGIQLCIYVFAVFHVHRKRDTAAMVFAAWCKSLLDLLSVSRLDKVALYRGQSRTDRISLTHDLDG